MSHSSKITSLPIKDIPALKNTVKELVKKGVRCELLQNVAPRMYYTDQLQRHYGRANEVCDYVLRLHDSPYDLAFIKDPKTGWLEPVYDKFRTCVKPDGTTLNTSDNRYGVPDVLGVPWEGQESHWAGLAQETVEILYGVGKFSREYAKQAGINLAMRHGKQIKSIEAQPTGAVRIRLRA